MGDYGVFIPILLMIFIMYFFMIKPQKKKERETTAMRNALRVGDEIVTIGGICGKIVKSKDGEEKITIQVGADKVKFEVMRWSVGRVVNEAEPIVNAKTEPVEEEKAKVKVVPKRLKKKESDEERAGVEG